MMIFYKMMHDTTIYNKAILAQLYTYNMHIIAAVILNQNIHVSCLSGFMLNIFSII